MGSVPCVAPVSFYLLRSAWNKKCKHSQSWVVRIDENTKHFQIQRPKWLYWKWPLLESFWTCHPGPCRIHQKYRTATGRSVKMKRKWSQVTWYTWYTVFVSFCLPGPRQLSPVPETTLHGSLGVCIAGLKTSAAYISLKGIACCVGPWFANSLQSFEPQLIGRSRSIEQKAWPPSNRQVMDHWHSQHGVFRPPATMPDTTVEAWCQSVSTWESYVVCLNCMTLVKSKCQRTWHILCCSSMLSFHSRLCPRGLSSNMLVSPQSERVC